MNKKVMLVSAIAVVEFGVICYKVYQTSQWKKGVNAAVKSNTAISASIFPASWSK